MENVVLVLIFNPYFELIQSLSLDWSKKSAWAVLKDFRWFSRKTKWPLLIVSTALLSCFTSLLFIYLQGDRICQILFGMCHVSHGQRLPQTPSKLLLMNSVFLPEGGH